MSKNSVNISVDREDRVYFAGETINGTIHVSVDKKENCKGLYLTRFCRTHGKGNRDEIDKSVTKLFQGVLTPGEYDFPFSVDVLNFPLTYHGHLINIDWYLRAYVDFLWKSRVCEVDFLVQRNPDLTSSGKSVYPSAYEKSVKHSASERIKNRILTIFVPLIFTGFRINEPWVWKFYALYLGLWGVWVLIGFTRDTIVGTRIGDVKFIIEPSHVVPGETVKGLLKFTPVTNISISGINAAMIGKETAQSGSGTAIATYNHQLCKEETPLLGSTELVANDPVSMEYSFNISHNSAPSHSSVSNDITWKIKVIICIDKFLDWEKEIQFQVL